MATNMLLQDLQERLAYEHLQLSDLDHNPIYYTIPRIRFIFKLPFGSYSMQRTQFPLRLAYCITYNKSQGQSLEWVVVDVTEPSFTHGYTYVAFSRVHDADHIATFVLPSQIHESGAIVTNVVYPTLSHIPITHVTNNRFHTLS